MKIPLGVSPERKKVTMTFFYLIHQLALVGFYLFLLVVSLFIIVFAIEFAIKIIKRLKARLNK